MPISTVVCPAGWKQIGDECKKTVKTDEICYLDPKEGSPPCFGPGGIIPVPKFIGGLPFTPTQPKVPTLEKQCGDVLQGYHDNIVQNIKELQSYELELFKKLQALETPDGIQPDTTKDIIDKISQISSIRTNLFNELQNMLTQEQCLLSNDRYDLADQISLLEITEKELSDIEKSMDSLQESKRNKLRMIEITNYESERYGAHRSIFRVLAYCSLGIILSVFLINKGFTYIGNTGVAVSVFLAGLLTMKSIWDAWWRSPMNWNQYVQSDSNRKWQSPGYETVWEHDKKAFWKGVGEVDYEGDSLWDETKSTYNKIKRDAGRDGWKHRKHGKHRKHR